MWEVDSVGVDSMKVDFVRVDLMGRHARCNNINMPKELAKETTESYLRGA